jgi:amino acid transporter
MSASTQPDANDAGILAVVTVRKITRRLIPILFVLYFAAWLDRVNVGFAALHMNSDLGFSSATFGLPIMLCFAQLVSYFTGTDGPVLYAGTAFGPIVGFQTGWCLYVGRLLGFAANANLQVNSLAYLLGGTTGQGLRVTLLFAVCSLLTLLNVVGARGAIHWLSALTILKFLPLIALVSFGLLKLHLNLRLQIPTGPHDLGAAVLLVLYVYTSFESGSVAAGEARDPQRDVPRALLAALFVCSVLYVLIQAVSIAALPALASTTRPLEQGTAGRARQSRLHRHRSRPCGGEPGPAPE